MDECFGILEKEFIVSVGWLNKLGAMDTGSPSSPTNKSGIRSVRSVVCKSSAGPKLPSNSLLAGESGNAGRKVSVEKKSGAGVEEVAMVVAEGRPMLAFTMLTVESMTESPTLIAESSGLHSPQGFRPASTASAALSKKTMGVLLLILEFPELLQVGRQKTLEGFLAKTKVGPAAALRDLLRTASFRRVAKSISKREKIVELKEAVDCFDEVFTDDIRSCER